MRKLRVCALFVFTGLHSLPLAGAPEEQTFRSDAQYVAVDVQVLSDETPVTGLQVGDFRVWDKGHPQRISTLGFDELDLDLLVLLDVSGSTTSPRQVMLLSAAEAMSHLYFRDRVGLLAFNLEPFLVAPLTWDRMEIIHQLRQLPPPEGGTELNTSIRDGVEYLKRYSRPGARRVIVVLTDNVAQKTSSDRQVEYDLWEADAVLSAILFKTNASGGVADVRKFVKATGGEALEWNPGKLPLVELFERIRKRYVLMYRAPQSRPGEVHHIRVDLGSEAKRRIKNLQIRARKGYISGRPGSEARKTLLSAQ